MKMSDLGYCACQDWYEPCSTGVHVCGRRHCSANKHAADEVPTTELNVPCTSVTAARRLFERLKNEFQDDDGDLVVDLVERDDITDDFMMRRQMLDRFKQASQNSNTH